MLPSGPQLLFDVRELFANRHESVTPLSELRHRSNSSLRLGLGVLPTIRRRAHMEKDRGTIIGETLAGAATIAITILTIAFFYRLVAL